MTRTLISILLLGATALAVAAPPAPPYGRSQSNALPRDLHYSIDSACLAADQDDTLVLVTFFSLLDPTSAQLSQQVLWDKQVRNRIGLLHTVEMDVDMGMEWTRKFEVQQVPTLILMTPEYKIIARSVGPIGPEAFINWVAQARQRVTDGVWEGLPLNRAEDKPQDPIASAIARLDSRDPSERRRARAALIDLREPAINPLIDALDDDYLGTRIAAYETLKTLAPDAPAYEPWLLTDTRTQQAQAVKQWWADAGKLAPPQHTRQLTPTETRTINDAVESIFADSPVRKTRAMTVLVDTGPSTLPSVRAAIARAERENDYAAVLLFEDVRWAILIPDKVEADLAVRHDLARGTSEQRQAATDRLGSVGKNALRPLRELINDDDTLVRESAIHALASVGGKDALAATATMLNAQDPNLRMVAAQQLGASGLADAGNYLASAIDDSDEVVALAAIAALEQAKAKKQSPDLIQALKDPRWRVRAAAAECLGKLDINAAVPDLVLCLEDEDPFVVKSALLALKEMNAQPDADKLIGLVSRQETMRPLVIEFLLEQDNAIAIDRILIMYRSSSDPAKLDILAALQSARSRQRNNDAHWRPLFNDVMASDNAAIRRRGVDLLSIRAYTIALEYIDAALTDPDPKVRDAAVSLITPLVAFHHGLTRDGDKLTGYGALSQMPVASTPNIETAIHTAVVEVTVEGDQAVENAVVHTQPNATQPNATQPTTTQPSAAPASAHQVQEQHQRWHDSLLKHAPDQPSPAYLFARFLTGDPDTEFAPIAKLITENKLMTQSSGLDPELVAPLLLTRIPMPQGMDVINQMAAEPFGYAQMLSATRHARPQIAEALTHPERITQALESATDGQAAKLLSQIIGDYNSPAIIAHMNDPQAEALVTRLASSNQPLPRAVGIFFAALRPGLLPPEAIKPALDDESPWVRRAAIQAYLASKPDPADVETTVGPMIADPNPHVGAAAASGILTDPLRIAAELPPPTAQFIYAATTIRRSWNGRQQTRPPQVIDRQPDFLPELKALSTKDIEDELGADVIALTLAQYGDFSGLDKRLEVWQAGNRQEVPGILLVALLLTKDDRYIDPLRQKLLQEESEYRIRELLNWLRGVRGTEARALRREINLKLREMSR